MSITDIVVQVVLFLTGAVAVYLTQQHDEELKRYSSLFGMAGQPFWYYTTLSTGQYGVFLLTIIYTYCWSLGIYNNWIKKNE